ncbi:MAG: ComF family protein [Alphaproteobacteria bacterium]|nr:MAG: ComF family protein [Alphaproteobacteria bacterium]
MTRLCNQWEGRLQRPLLERLIHLVYPPRCAGCGTLLAEDGGLCGRCWRQTPFIMGLVCDCCGAPLMGAGEEAGRVLCDDCQARARPWSRGRAALLYEGKGRDYVLALKLGDRHDLLAPMSRWLAQAAAPLLEDAPGLPLAVPVPLHRWRLLSRRFNQSALLARGVARRLGIDCAPAALCRCRPTPHLEGSDSDARFVALAGSIAPSARGGEQLRGRMVLLVDDVMTSGATLSAAAEAALAAGAREVRTLVLARARRSAQM